MLWAIYSTARVNCEYIIIPSSKKEQLNASSINHTGDRRSEKIIAEVSVQNIDELVRPRHNDLEETGPVVSFGLYHC